MGETVLYDASEGVATLTLNRPERLNAITPELIEDLRAALHGAWDDPGVRVIRLRGAGRAFCAGYDIGWGSASMEEAEAGRPWDAIADYETLRGFVDAYMSLWRSPKPVIAQVLDQLGHDRVQALRPVERERGDPVGGLVHHGLGHRPAA